MEADLKRQVYTNQVSLYYIVAMIQDVNMKLTIEYFQTVQ